MAHYQGDPVPFHSPLTVPRVPAHRTTMIDRSRPSAVRVFAKSLYVLAAGWLLSVTWLWVAEVRQHIYRFGTRPDGLAWTTIVLGAIPAILIAVLASWFARITPGAATLAEERREWNQAFWWSLFPTLLMLATAYVMIGAAG
jgi:hypothetical protein